jgi:protein-L-isoaspartate O-methyltransferase
MVGMQIAGRGVQDQQLLVAMRQISREVFVDANTASTTKTVLRPSADWRAANICNRKFGIDD